MRLPHQPGCHQAGCTRLAMLSVTRCNPTFLASIPRQKVQPPRQRAPHPQRVTLIVAATSDASAAQQHAVRFSLCYQAQFGQQIRLVGSSPAAGMWNPAKSLPLTWTEGDEWVLDAKFPAGYAHLCASGASAIFVDSCQIACRAVHGHGCACFLCWRCLVWCGCLCIRIDCARPNGPNASIQYHA